MKQSVDLNTCASDGVRTINKFFIAEGRVSVKVVFDNLRNYLICASLIGTALWLPTGMPKLPSTLQGAEFSKYAIPVSWTVMAVAGVLALLNVLQTLEIQRALFFDFLDRFVDSLDNLNDRIGRRIGILSFAVILLALLGVYLAICLVVTLTVIYAVVFQVNKL